MKVKIDDSVICIPPHISTTWDEVTFLQSEENAETKRFTLILHLADEKIVKIPDLDASIIDIAFGAHMKHLETKKEAPRPQKSAEEPKTLGGFLQQITGLSPDQLNNMPIQFGVSGSIPGMENIQNAMQHDQSKADTPDVPQEVLDKITEMAKMVSGGNLEDFPKPEPHCNCMHCQLARSIHNMEKSAELEEEIVSDDELTFRSWDIQQNGDHLYIVTNPLNSGEQYSVFLGKPVGCTCGQADCEHIKAVLYS